MTWEETKSFLAPYLPAAVNDALASLVPGTLQEIRIRAGKPCILRCAGSSATIRWEPALREVETLADADRKTHV